MQYVCKLYWPELAGLVGQVSPVAGSCKNTDLFVMVHAHPQLYNQSSGGAVTGTGGSATGVSAGSATAGSSFVAQKR